MRRVRLQYNDVPGSDEEMELGLGSDASLASSCGERSCPLGVQSYLCGWSWGTGLATGSRRGWPVLSNWCLREPIVLRGQGVGLLVESDIPEGA